jgi:hypothetical protein
MRRGLVMMSTDIHEERLVMMGTDIHEERLVMMGLTAMKRGQS